jgi:3-dehydroquinate dehydratase II
MIFNNNEFAFSHLRPFRIIYMINRPIIFILLGPNLNMLGVREPHLYGSETMADIERMCRNTANTYHFDIDFRQSNHEGDLVTWIQEAREKSKGLILNAAAYTHTSIAISDALKMLENVVPIVEVHHSNPKEREPYRHHSYVEDHASAHFAGFGSRGYQMALEILAEKLGTK